MKRSGFKMRSGNSPLAFKLMGSKVEKTDERGATDEEINNMMNHYVENDTVHPSQVKSTDIEEKTDTEVDTGEKKKGWKFDIDWDEVGTEAIKTGVKMGIAALSAGTKKPPRRSGSIGSFAAHKFGTNTDITKS